MRRTRDFNVLFQPGYDHAGIATQSVVEKALEHDGLSRRRLGRAAFEERVWEWLRLYGGTIMTQFRRMGASMDYRRERFTMDDGYPRADGEGHITIATVRPATILADVAVAVHPDDERYRRLVGKEAIVPFVERRVPIIADERVEPEFGTGALKVTPGHDPKDFEIGRAHGLPEPMVIGPDGRMNDEAGELAGLTQREADERVLEWLREHDQLEKVESYRHTVALCERCESRIEPLISVQWWCSMEELKKPALEALREGRVRYHPESQHRFAVESLENAPDWNISRQLWWGHQLPVWECPDGHETVEESEPEACATCGSHELTRSEDVLDTWFSAALWPFAILGWPDETSELRAWYPGSLNTTSREIIRLWENRMIFSGLELMGDIPFSDVIIHTTVLAPDGRRMSKSLGTGIDPLDLIAHHGADATRYGLLKMSSSQDVRFNLKVIEEGRSLANKLWNVARLILANTEGAEPAIAPRELEERWILARLDATRAQLEESWVRYEFAPAANALYHLTFDDFCDWYAEAIKPRFQDQNDTAVRSTALAALERLLKLLHPVMPHVTEEIWSQLPAREQRLIATHWPEADERFASDRAALNRIQEAALIFRRSGVRPKLAGDEQRIFEAGGPPGSIKAGGGPPGRN